MATPNLKHDSFQPEIPSLGPSAPRLASSPQPWHQIGRLLGGIATSLLFSAFESWLVAEHFSRGFDEKWLGDTFSKVCVRPHLPPGSHWGYAPVKGACARVSRTCNDTSTTHARFTTRLLPAHPDLISSTPGSKACTRPAHPPRPACCPCAPPPCLQAVFVGNGLMAILAGLVASYLVDSLKMGPVAPFDAAIVVLLAGGVVIYASWPENYGDHAHAAEGVVDVLRRQFAVAAGAIIGGESGVGGGGREGGREARVAGAVA